MTKLIFILPLLVILTCWGLAGKSHQEKYIKTKQYTVGIGLRPGSLIVGFNYQRGLKHGLYITPFGPYDNRLMKLAAEGHPVSKVWGESHSFSTELPLYFLAFPFWILAVAYLVIVVAVMRKSVGRLFHFN